MLPRATWTAGRMVARSPSRHQVSSRRELGRRSELGSRRRLSSAALPISELPIVDVQAADAHLQIRDAAERVGFFMITNHGVPQEQMDETFGALRDYFDQPMAAKLANHISGNDGIRGYGGLFEQGGYAIDATDVRASMEGGGGDLAAPPTLMDAKEVFHLGRQLPKIHPSYNHDMFASNVWPNDAVFRRGPVEAHMASMYELSERMFTLFARSLELPDDHFRALCDEGMDSMNLLHYPPLAAADKDPDQLGIGAEGPPGLEVLLPSTGEWCRVAPVPGAIVVNVGDLLARWSNDTFKSTVHRAVNDEAKDRLAIGFFRCCNYDTIVENLIEGSASKYPPVLAGEHMLARIEDANTVP